MGNILITYWRNLNLKILSIDTSSNICSIALLEDTNTIQELNIKNAKTHSENLMPLLDKLLTTHHLDLEDIECIVCDKGPGSFTGIRIGIATAKALAQVRRIPVVGITSLQALAYQVSPERGIICSIIDARNSNVYCGIFNKNHVLLQDYVADHIQNILPLLQKHSFITFVGDASLLHEIFLRENLSSHLIFSGIEDLSASSLGACGFIQFQLGNFDDADSLLPLYLRKSQAERMKELNGH